MYIYLYHPEPFTFKLLLAHVPPVRESSSRIQIKVSKINKFFHAQTAQHCKFSTCDGVILLCCKLNTQVCGLKAGLGSRPSRHAQPFCFALQSTLDSGNFLHFSGLHYNRYAMPC
jgi:hypothetical protein